MRCCDFASSESEAGSVNDDVDSVLARARAEPCFVRNKFLKLCAAERNLSSVVSLDAPTPRSSSSLLAMSDFDGNVVSSLEESLAHRMRSHQKELLLLMTYGNR